MEGWKRWKGWRGSPPISGDFCGLAGFVLHCGITGAIFALPEIYGATRAIWRFFD
jgi:hypothetical protein